MTHKLLFGELSIPPRVDSVRVTFSANVVNHFANDTVASRNFDLILARSEAEHTLD